MKKLTPMQYRAVTLRVEGKTYVEIGEQLHMTYKSVKIMLSRCYAKLDLRFSCEDNRFFRDLEIKKAYSLYKEQFKEGIL